MIFLEIHNLLEMIITLVLGFRVKDLQKSQDPQVTLILKMHIAILTSWKT